MHLINFFLSRGAFIRESTPDNQTLVSYIKIGKGMSLLVIVVARFVSKLN